MIGGQWPRPGDKAPASTELTQEVSGEDASLSGCLTDEEEIIEISFLIANNITVDDCAAWWILDR